jgi:hypothetical protein
MKHLPNGTGLESSPLDGRPGSQAEADQAPSEPVKEAYDHARFKDDFYPGLIVFLDPVRGRGVIRSSSGREIRFEFPFVTVVGAELAGRAPGIDLLHQGDTVGFDMGWTSRGLRVTRIKPASF